MFEPENNEEILLNADVKIIAAELEHFHHQNGGTRLLPNIKKEESVQSDWILFRIIDGDAEASISLRPDRNSSTLMMINVNETHLWGWILGESGRSELGETTFLGGDTSSECETFCTRFVDYLEQAGYLGHINPENKPKGGRPSYPDDEWARSQHFLENRDYDEVYQEWQRRPGVVARDLDDPKDSFRHLIRTPPKT